MRKYIYSFIALCAILNLSSCGIKYQRPEIEEENLVRYSDKADSTFDVSTIHWKDYYQDPLLCELIDSALVNNYDMKTAIYRIEQSAAYFNQSKWAIAPNLGASVNAGVNGSTGDYDFDFSAGLNFSWEIDIWGRLSKAKKSRYQALLAQVNTKNLIQTQLIANVASLYYNLITLEFNHNFVLETIDNRETYLSTVKSLKESGQVNEIAVLQAESQLLGAKAYLPDLEYNIQELENQIRYLMGEHSAAIAKDISSLKDIINEESFRIDSIGIPMLLLRNRPDILASENNLVSKLEGYNSSRAALYPTLRLTANASIGYNFLWGVTGGLLEPILNGRSLRTQRDIAKKDMEIAANEFQSTVAKAGMEVSNLLYKQKVNKSKLEYQYKNFIVLDNAYKYSVELLKNGYATYLDVLSAQEGVFNAQIDLSKGLKDYISTQVNLYRALGGGWESK